jgi:hypothetical protein
LSVRVAVCALAMLIAGSAQAQTTAPSPPDAGVPPDAAVDAGAEAGASERDARADGLAGTDAGVADARAPDVTPRPAVSAAPTPTPAPAALRGTVFAKGGHRRIKGATIFIDGAAVADTDDNGNFAVMAAPGRHRVQAIASKYQAVGITVDLPPAGWAGELRLPAGGQTYETVVATK